MNTSEHDHVRKHYVYKARVPLHLAKETRDLCYIEDILIKVPGVNDGDNIRIISLSHGLLFHKRYYACGEVIPKKSLK